VYHVTSILSSLRAFRQKVINFLFNGTPHLE
jgi:hypothetical protein